MARVKGGKYAHVVGKLPKMPLAETPDRQAILDTVKEEILTPPLPNDDLTLPVGTVQDKLGLMNVCFSQILLLEKRACAGKPWAAEFARAWADLRKIDALMSEWQSSLNLLLEVYERLMIDQMEVEGITSMKLANGQPISTWLEPYCYVKDPEAFRQWCLKQTEWVPVTKDGEIVFGEDSQPVMEERCIFEKKMALHPSTVQSLTKEMLLAGQPEPDGVEMFARPKTRLGSE